MLHPARRVAQMPRKDVLVLILVIGNGGFSYEDAIIGLGVGVGHGEIGSTGALADHHLPLTAGDHLDVARLQALEASCP